RIWDVLIQGPGDRLNAHAAPASSSGRFCAIADDAQQTEARSSFKNCCRALGPVRRHTSRRNRSSASFGLAAAIPAFVRALLKARSSGEAIAVFVLALIFARCSGVRGRRGFMKRSLLPSRQARAAGASASETPPASVGVFSDRRTHQERRSGLFRESPFRTE